MYSILWKYKVHSEHKKEFEAQYGFTGSWSKLFGRSDNYLGSTLHKNDEAENIYLLIDN